MPDLRCFRLNEEIEGEPTQNFDDYVELDDSVTPYDPVTVTNFTAKLYVRRTPAREPQWADFLEPARERSVDQAQDLDFPGWPLVSSAGALLLVRVDNPQLGYFGFTFGAGGRMILKQEAYRRVYGLRTALNLIYPSADSSDDFSRLRSVDARRHGAETVRSRHQTSRAAPFETFDIDQSRSIVDAAVGRPANQQAWGKRISGTDSIGFSIDVNFEELGNLCTRVHEAAERQDYQERFPWIDNIRPVKEPRVLAKLSDEIVARLSAKEVDDLEMNPPEIIDWERVVSFRIPYDKKGVIHPELRIVDYLNHLEERGDLQDLTEQVLRRQYAESRDGDGSKVNRWSIFKCITGTIEVDGINYVLDGGQFYEVDLDYISGLDKIIDQITEFKRLPPTSRTTREDKYNAMAATSGNRILMDKKLVRIQGQTPIELCDILTPERELIHVKRHLGSRDLSHLFSQGVVSAELLQSNLEFRAEARAMVEAEQPDSTILSEEPFQASDFTVVYAIAEQWGSDSLSDRLPLFSKVTLSHSVQELTDRGYKVACARIDAT